MSAAPQPMMNALRRARRWMNQALGRDVRVPVQARCAEEFLGSEYGGWWVCPEGIDASSVVYSFGVGEDISFDLAVIRRFGVRVHAFDPTPRSIAWLKRQSLPEGFHFHDIGLADYDGEAMFEAPPEGHVSFTMKEGGGAAADRSTIRARVERLDTIARRLGHSRIDVLKMDIEGAEIPVIADLGRASVQIGQLLVEFHHAIGDAKQVATTRAAIDTLGRLGFRLFHNSAVGREFSFIRVENAG